MTDLEQLRNIEEQLNTTISSLIEKQRNLSNNQIDLNNLDNKLKQSDTLDHRSNKMLDSKNQQIEYSKHKTYSLILFIIMLVVLIIVLFVSSFNPKNILNSSFKTLKSIW